MSDAPPNIDEIARLLRRGEASPRVLVRVLLSWFGKKGRGSTVVQTIRTALSAAGLRTVPDFAVVYLDAEVAFELVQRAESNAQGSKVANAQSEAARPSPLDELSDTHPGTRVGMLPSATLGISRCFRMHHSRTRSH